MSERKVIEDKRRQKRNEITTLEHKLKAVKVYIKALNDVLAILDKEDDPSASDTKLRKGSLVDQAREIILERDEPVHLDDLLRAMGKDVTRDAKGSLNGSLAAYERKGEIFVRTAPATYGLIELSHASEEEVEEETPPAGFGGPSGHYSIHEADTSALDDDMPS